MLLIGRQEGHPTCKKNPALVIPKSSTLEAFGRPGLNGVISPEKNLFNKSWLGSRTCDQQVAGPPWCPVQPWASCLHTHVPIIKQYNLVSATGLVPNYTAWWLCLEVTVGLGTGSLPAGLWLRSPAGWLPRTGISSGTLRLFRVWDCLTFKQKPVAANETE